MILKHYIKIENNEEILVVHLDYNYEFSKFDHNSSIIRNITEYIHKHKIKFNGNKVILVVGSLMLGTLILNPINYDNSLKNKEPYTYVSKITLATYNDKNELTSIQEINTKDKTVTEKTIEQKANTTTTNSTNNNSQTISKKNSTATKKTTTQKVSIQKKSSTSSSQKSSTQNSTSTSNKQATTTKSATTQSKSSIIVTVYRNNGQVIKLDLEEYIIGVVGAEMPASFSNEALKAQALVSRTYALKAIQNGKKLTDTVSTQVYKDNSQLKAMWGSSYNTYYTKVKNAVNATKGMYISYNNQYIDAVFHSTSNGYTENASNVWKNTIPYLTSVESSWDKSASSFIRTITMSYSEVSKILGFEINNDTPIEILSKTKSNRIATIKIGNKKYTGIELRTLLNLRSTDFEINSNDKIEITTKGYGHGVGMSQYGANGMAKAGYNYSQIIKHYYQGVSISKIK